jgi:2-C-methyl-D-erythritol 4-phosphate cytidylyltransferase/2-C-methyl-D-erythritol 2,4-cyclodiphosphate synthase
MTAAKRTASLLLAAGNGTRMPGPLPKQFRKIRGEALIVRAARALLAVPGTGVILPVIAKGDEATSRDALASLADPRLMPSVTGGETRRLSVLAGLKALTGVAPELVLVHDAARPFPGAAMIGRVLEGLRHRAAIFPALPVTDTVWRRANGLTAVPRDGLYRAQTPQGFHFAPFLAAHLAYSGEASDDIAVALSGGMEVAMVEGEERNMKVTHPGDELRAAALLGPDVRTGQGFDVHAFVPGDHVVLGGQRIAFDRGLNGHSDSDVLLHAITDALFGALAEGDIGTWFPPSDPAWKGAPSRTFLEKAAALARERGAEISHIDATLICEAPKIAPHAPAMRAFVAACCGLEMSRVGLKATTTEGLGFPGRGEGIAALATATLVFA